MTEFFSAEEVFFQDKSASNGHQPSVKRQCDSENRTRSLCGSFMKELI